MLPTPRKREYESDDEENSSPARRNASSMFTRLRSPASVKKDVMKEINAWPPSPVLEETVKSIQLEHPEYGVRKMHWAVIEKLAPKYYVAESRVRKMLRETTDLFDRVPFSASKPPQIPCKTPAKTVTLIDAAPTSPELTKQKPVTNSTPVFLQSPVFYELTNAAAPEIFEAPASPIMASAENSEVPILVSSFEQSTSDEDPPSPSMMSYAQPSMLSFAHTSFASKSVIVVPIMESKSMSAENKSVLMAESYKPQVQVVQTIKTVLVSESVATMLNNSINKNKPTTFDDHERACVCPIC